MMDKEKQIKWVEKIILGVTGALPRGVEFEDWQAYERLLATGLTCAQWITVLAINTQQATLLLNKIAGYIQLAKADYQQAELLWLNSLASKEETLGKDHPDVATTLNNLAELYRTLGKYTEDEPLYQRSLAIREKALGKDHPDVAQSLNNLAYLFYSQGKYTEAEPLFQRSLAILEKALGKDHPDVATNLNNLAKLYEDQGIVTEAEPLYQRSLAICEKALGRAHPNTKTVRANLQVLQIKLLIKKFWQSVKVAMSSLLAKK